MDLFTKRHRSQIMSRIRSRSTRPELTVRTALLALGVRHRRHVRSMPGTPDLVLTRLQVAVFINGCFWHGHAKCIRARLPKTNRDFWRTKIASNMQRDRRNADALRRAGWGVMTIWTCSNLSVSQIALRLRRFNRRLGTSPGGRAGAAR